MKINFTYIKKILLKYKYIVLGILVIIIFFSFPVPVSREGMLATDCEYVYLDPTTSTITENDKPIKDGWDYWPADIKQKFAEAYFAADWNKLSADEKKIILKATEKDPKYGDFIKLFNDVHLGEAQYFIKNGAIFRPPYLLKRAKKSLRDQLKNNPQSLPPGFPLDNAGIESLDSKSFQKLFPGNKTLNRQLMAEIVKTLSPSDQLPEDKLAISIYNGSKGQPCLWQGVELLDMTGKLPPEKLPLARFTISKLGGSLSTTEPTEVDSTKLTWSSIPGLFSEFKSLALASPPPSALTGNGFQQFSSICKNVLPN